MRTGRTKKTAFGKKIIKTYRYKGHLILRTDTDLWIDGPSLGDFPIQWTQSLKDAKEKISLFKGDK